MKSSSSRDLATLNVKVTQDDFQISETNLSEK